MKWIGKHFMIKAKAFIFDLGGTLIDTKMRFYSIFNKNLKKFGIKPLSWKEFREKYSQGKINDCILPEGSKDRERKLDQFWKNLSQDYRGGNDPPIPGAKEVLRKIYQAKIPIAAATYVMLPPEETKKELTRYGIAKFISCIITAFQGEGKHYLLKKEIIPKAIAKLGIPPKDCVVVGDTVEDVEGGKGVGAKTVAVLSGLVTEKYLKKAKPDAIIDSVAQLFEVVEIT